METHTELDSFVEVNKCRLTEQTKEKYFTEQEIRTPVPVGFESERAYHAQTSAQLRVSNIAQSEAINTRTTGQVKKTKKNFREGHHQNAENDFFR